jgi:hypothetical protein
MKILFTFTLNIFLVSKIFSSNTQYSEIYRKVAAMLRQEESGYSLCSSTIEGTTRSECLPNTLFCITLAWATKCRYMDLNQDIPSEEFSNYCFPYFSPDDAQSLIDQASIAHKTQQAKIFSFLTTGQFEPLPHEPFQYCKSYRICHRGISYLTRRQDSPQLKLFENYSIECSDDYPIKEENGKQYKITHRFQDIEEIIIRQKPVEVVPQIPSGSPSEDDDWILCKLQKTQ